MSDVQAKELHILFCERMRTRRKELKLTQTQLAERMGVDQSYVSDLERGATRPLFDSLASLAEALQVEPGYLVTCETQLSEK